MWRFIKAFQALSQIIFRKNLVGKVEWKCEFKEEKRIMQYFFIVKGEFILLVLVD